MRIHITPGFSSALAAHAAANAAYDAHLDENEVGLDEELHGPHAKAESQALYAVLDYPATTPAEIAAKLSVMRDRGIDTCVNGYPGWMAQIERELIELQRPCVSPLMASTFEKWRDAHLAYHEDFEGEGNSERHSAAFLAMMAAPCSTPGDFIVKVYANQLGEHGSTYLGPGCDNPPGAFPFELDDSRLDEGVGRHDAASETAFARDIRESDLGRCLLALGRIDFDAEAWFAAVRRAGMVAMVIQTDGTQALWAGQPQGDVGERAAHRFDICQALLGAGMGVVGEERRASVIDFIASKHPDLVMDCRVQCEVAA